MIDISHGHTSCSSHRSSSLPSVFWKIHLSPPLPSFKFKKSTESTQRQTIPKFSSPASSLAPSTPLWSLSSCLLVSEVSFWPGAGFLYNDLVCLDKEDHCLSNSASHSCG
ncbi:CQS_1a_G0019220.mRNA.1.CDS.1 [Saccharomyces cerevisiae]|nr:CQS_1a_G0019220.mRNA.1.CDS.1 [Saccharomyces cerevisiae]CAI7292767.1 CQS_1a_G0019220.mRNA.1.CDS.1 [Saccharomyces cerevisiae]